MLCLGNSSGPTRAPHNRRMTRPLGFCQRDLWVVTRAEPVAAKVSGIAASEEREKAWQGGACADMSRWTRVLLSTLVLTGPVTCFCQVHCLSTISQLSLAITFRCWHSSPKQRSHRQGCLLYTSLVGIFHIYLQLTNPYSFSIRSCNYPFGNLLAPTFRALVKLGCGLVPELLSE